MDKANKHPLRITLLGIFFLYIGISRLLGGAFSIPMINYIFADRAHFPAATPTEQTFEQTLIPILYIYIFIQLGVGLVLSIAAIEFLRLRRWARKCLVVMTWIAFIPYVFLFHLGFVVLSGIFEQFLSEHLQTSSAYMGFSVLLYAYICGGFLAFIIYYLSSRITRDAAVKPPSSAKQYVLYSGLFAGSTTVLMIGFMALLSALHSAPGRITEDREFVIVRTFNSEMLLEVRATITEGEKWNVTDWERIRIGATPSDEPLQIPECVYWYIRPRDLAVNIDWEALIDLIRRENVPGLAMPRDASDQHMSHLAGLENIWSLSLSRTDVTDDGLAHLTGLRELRWLNISRTDVTDEGLAHLAGLENLKELVLNFTAVTDAGLTHLAGMKNLRVLDLWEADVTDEGLAHLAGLENLRVLSLARTDVTDEGLAHLTGLENLRELNLWQTDVTDEGVQKLKEALPDLLVIK